MHLRRFVHALAGGFALSLLGLAFGSALEGCSSGPDSTSGKRVVLHTRVTVADAARSEFQTDLGWSVTLERAAVAAGPFYYFDGAPPLVRREAPAPPWRFAQRLLGLSLAHAHPGHYQAGNALGQMLQASSLELLDDAADFPDGDGVTGTYRSARFTIAAPTGPAQSALGRHAALAVGAARKDGEATRYFRAFADLAEIEQHASQGQIDGCELTEVNVEGDGTVNVTVNPRVWFNLVDFTTTGAGSADEPAEFPADSNAQIAFVLGVTQLSAYKFTYLAD